MVGLVGIVTAGIVTAQKNDIDIRPLLIQMCESIKHKDEHKVEYHIDDSGNKGDKNKDNGNDDNKDNNTKMINTGIGRVHIGIFNSEPQPIFNDDRTLCIMMDGEIYDYHNTKNYIKNELISKGHKFYIGNDPELILHLYEEYGKNFIHKLNGIFTIVIWNERSRELLIANDRYGLRPIYYTNINGYLLFGSEVKAILQDKNFNKNIDNRSVAEFFSFGYILGNKTLFQEIERLSPASIMTFNGKISIEKYWDYDFNKKYENHSEEYYVENLSRVMLQSVERQMKGTHKISVLLSGGLDSRAVIGSISRDYYPIHTITYGRPNCNDTKFAQMIADQLGTIHHFFELKSEDIVPYIENVSYISDGMLNVLNANWLLSHILEDMSKFSDVSFHGWIGDTITGSGYLVGNLKDSDSNFQLFKRLCTYIPIDFEKLFRDNYYPTYEKNMKLSKDYISDLGEDIKLPENRLTYINLKERQYRLISTGFVYMRNFLEFRTPFTDYNYVDFNMEIPPTFKINKYLYKKMILKMFPDLREIPYQKTGLPLYESNYLKISLYQAKYLFKQIVNIMMRKIYGSSIFSDEREFADYGKWIRTNKNLRNYIYNILSDKRTLSRSYFNQTYIKNILDDHMNGKKDYSTFIGLLITFELWNRQFIDIK